MSFGTQKRVRHHGPLRPFNECNSCSNVATLCRSTFCQDALGCVGASQRALWKHTGNDLIPPLICLQAPRKHGDEGDVQPHWDHYATWQMTTQAGPQFAALNGDINLIHLHPITARLFGFKSNIAHGTYLVSKAVAAMQHGRHPLTAAVKISNYAVKGIFKQVRSCKLQGPAIHRLFCHHACTLQVRSCCTLRPCQHCSRDQPYCLTLSNAAGSKLVQVVHGLLSAPAAQAKLPLLENMPMAKPP